jgi:glucose/arabinose dehydrogenase
MAFLGNGDLIVLEIENGTVRRVINDSLQQKPLFDVNVSRVTGERGMLGVTVSKNINGHEYVFLYFTESNVDGGEPIGNRLYRYEFRNDKLINPKMLLDLPVKPGPYHNGGSITIGPDNNVYLTIGDLDNVDDKVRPNTITQNVKNGDEPNGSGGILRVTQTGKVVGEGIIGNTYPSNLYYAYGIRNSFGIAFDPLTGNLWDTENGPNFGDEINLVKPGFNSGSLKVNGIWQNEQGNIGHVLPNPKDLVDFDGRGNYSMPEFSWKGRHGPTALIFLDSAKLGKNYYNDLFVGDMHNGSIFHFDLTNDRNELSLGGPLKDKVADYNKELEKNLFAKDFSGGITDLEVGPDGYLYVVSGIWGCEGNIYRIVP